MTEYEKLEAATAEARAAAWRRWAAESDALAAEILKRRGGQPIDAEALWDAVRTDRKTRDIRLLGG